MNVCLFLCCTSQYPIILLSFDRQSCLIITTSKVAYLDETSRWFAITIWMFIYFRTYLLVLFVQMKMLLFWWWVMFGHQFLKIIAALVSLVCLSLISWGISRQGVFQRDVPRHLFFFLKTDTFLQILKVRIFWVERN